MLVILWCPILTSLAVITYFLEKNETGCHLFDKCKSVSYCLKLPINTSYHIVDKNQVFSLEKVNSVVDLGVHFDSNLTFRDHISEKLIKLTVY